jgi:predicted CoA-binding protein
MDLKEIMEAKTFVVLGNTIDEDKYAYKIKNKLIEKNYNVYAVSKELKSINDVDADDFILDLCINPIKGLEYLKENKKKIKAVLIQPGAISDDIINFLNEKKIPYLEGCALVGISLYKK